MLAKARAELAEVGAKLEKLTDAMLASAGDGVPLTFAKRARELEAEQIRLHGVVQAAERDLTATARTDIHGTDAAWQRLAAGVEAQDPEARLQTRQLVADTFQKIVIYQRGVRPTLFGPFWHVAGFALGAGTALLGPKAEVPPGFWSSYWGAAVLGVLFLAVVALVGLRLFRRAPAARPGCPAPIRSPACRGRPGPRRGTG